MVKNPEVECNTVLTKAVLSSILPAFPIKTATSHCGYWPLEKLASMTEELNFK